MRILDKPLLTSFALAAILPAAAFAQEAVDPGPALDPSVLGNDTMMTDTAVADDADMDVTLDSAAAMTDAPSLTDWNYDRLYASGISIEEIVGAEVYDPEGEDIGDVENILFDMDGNVVSLVAEIGGFLDLGDTHVSIPWDRVAAEQWEDGVVIPFTEDDVEDYVLAEEEVVSLEGLSQVEQVSGDGLGEIETGPQVWAATEMLGDYVRLREGEGYADTGLVNDMIIQDGRIAAVVVDSAGLAGGEGAFYGYPYGGLGGWDREAGYYDMPYDRTEAGMMQPFDPAMLDG